MLVQRQFRFCGATCRRSRRSRRRPRWFIVTSLMSSQGATVSIEQKGAAADSAWTMLRAASAMAEALDREGDVRAFREDEALGLQPLAEKFAFA